MPPRLLAGGRWATGLTLAFVALVQAGLAAAFADAVGNLASQSAAMPAREASAAAGLAMAIGLAVLIERATAERFAQSFVQDCRARIFDAVIRNRGEGNESRWLTALVGDLAAIRNYAVRGSVKLWTSLLAGISASGWFLLSFPQQAGVLMPFAIGLLLILGTTLLLRRQITLQRSARGRLNRFLIRRVRIEMTAAPSPRGHGTRRLATLSGELRERIERRALVFGAMEFLAAAVGGLAAVALVAGMSGARSPALLVGQISLIGFIASRLLETARALHAQAGGQIALDRLARLLARDPSKPSPSGPASGSDLD